MYAAPRLLPALICACTLSACDSGAAVERGLAAPWASPFSVGPLAEQGELCTRTDGVWSAPWVSCLCPVGMLFAVDTGCSPAALSAAMQGAQGHFTQLSASQLQEALATLNQGGPLQLTGDLTHLAQAELIVLRAALDANPTALLAGMTLPKALAASRTLHHLERATVDNVDRLWGDDRELDYPARMTLSSGDPLTALREATPDPAAFCSAALAAAASPHSAALCDGASRALTALATAPAGVAPFVANLSEEGAGCLPDCALVASYDLGAGLSATYVAVMQQYLPLSRRLRIAGPDASELVLFLSPAGRQEAAVLHTHTLVPEGAALLQSHRRVFGPRWESLAHQETMRGDRAGLHRVLTAPRPEIMAKPQVAMVVDSGIDPRLPELSRRLLLAQPTRLDSFAASAEPFGMAHASPIENLLLLLDDDPLEGRHGTRVAALVGEDLPALRLAFIAALRPLQPTSADAWTAHIRASGAALVNISATYARSAGICERFFRQIFSSLPQVLFVVAAGNNGASEPVGTCPGNLGQAYDNVLTVAGSQAGGRVLHPHSNHGVNTAKVAAPYEAMAPDVGGSMAPVRHAQALMQGTSVAAAQVSNTALRFWARQPHLSAVQVADRLMASCTPAGLDVLCGGVVDGAALGLGP